MNIFVGNLSFQTSEEQLLDVFTPFGEVSSVKVIVDGYSNRSRGFAFVEMPVSEHALTAIERLNESMLDSRVIVVNEAKPKRSNDCFSSNRSW